MGTLDIKLGAIEEVNAQGNRYVYYFPKQRK